MAWTTNAVISSLKFLLISAGALWIASSLRFSVPLLIRFSISKAPWVWNSLRSWLRPPYLYFVINGIIISIVASMMFQRNDEETEVAAEPSPASQYERKWTEPVEEKKVVVEYRDRGDEAEDEEELVPSTNIDYSMEIPSSQPLPINHSLFSPRLAYPNRKPAVKFTPQAAGGWRSSSLRVTKPKEQHETMDDTWKMITAGREAALTWQTSENHGREMVVCEGQRRSMKKSETFRDRTNYYNDAEPPTARLSKEPSLDQEELNRRAEEFIKKFNQEMKLQRQESLGHD